MNANEIMEKTLIMAGKVYEALLLTEKGFMENRSEPLTSAMKEEHLVNDMERALTKDIIEISKAAKNASEKEDLARMAQVIETLERIGDETVNIIERVEIKVTERLLFSELGVQQFNETYNTMKKSVEMMIEFLKEARPELKDKIVDNGFHVKRFVERYRKAHFERLVRGECTPIAANMYFDMLDFTGNIARHSSNIVKLFKA